MSPAAPEFVVIWRDGDSAALQTYAHDTNKAARVFKGHESPEVQGTDVVNDDDALERLLATPGPFEKTRVPKQSAKRVLGWTV